ncbi:MAG: DUF6171 family protein [Clostridiales bacterium]|jgi:hypothetical protein|nr:DUF6171 family protein [Clostridiales bacterium]
MVDANITPIGVFCPRCEEKFAKAAGYGENYRQTLEKYLTAIPPEIKTSPEEYNKRIGLCEGCGQYLADSFTCLMCGCYVQMRAAKEVISCPLSKW